MDDLIHHCREKYLLFSKKATLVFRVLSVNHTKINLQRRSWKWQN